MLTGPEFVWASTERSASESASTLGSDIGTASVVPLRAPERLSVWPRRCRDDAEAACLATAIWSTIASMVELRACEQDGEASRARPG